MTESSRSGMGKVKGSGGRDADGDRGWPGREAVCIIARPVVVCLMEILPTCSPTNTVDRSVYHCLCRLCLQRNDVV